jgi:hypothetical protein
VLRDNPTKPLYIKKGFIYADDINVGIEIEDHLGKILPSHLCQAGLICPYNAVHGKDYLDKVMNLFKKGLVQILICTDAVGMVSTSLSI